MEVNAVLVILREYRDLWLDFGIIVCLWRFVCLYHENIFDFSQFKSLMLRYFSLKTT